MHEITFIIPVDKNMFKVSNQSLDVLQVSLSLALNSWIWLLRLVTFFILKEVLEVYLILITVVAYYIEQPSINKDLRE